MRTILIVLTGIVATATAQLPPWLVPGAQKPAASLQPAPIPKPPGPEEARASIQAHSIRVGSATQDNWKTSWGSYDRDYARMQHVLVTVTPWGKAPITGAVEIIWFGREIVTDGVGRRVVLKKESRPLTVPGADPQQNMIFHSGLITGNITRYRALGESYTSGMKIEGWYVRFVAQNRTLHDLGSHTYLSDICRDPGKLASIYDCSEPAAGLAR